MANQMSEEQIYEEASRKVKAKRSFWGNFISYAVVNIICFSIWALTRDSPKDSPGEVRAFQHPDNP